MKRKTTEAIKTYDKCSFTVQQVIEYLFKENELDDKYDIHLSNCQHFAHRLWRKFCRDFYGETLLLLLLLFLEITRFA